MDEKNIYSRWRECWRRYLLGNNWEESLKESKAVITSLENIADARSNKVEHLGGGSITYMNPIFHLRALTIAYCTPGTKYYRKIETKEEIINGLKYFHEEEYNLLSSSENWWTVEIGIPLRLLDILFLLYEELPDRSVFIENFTDTILHFQSAYEQTSRGRKETGANLVWKCHIQLLTGILREDMQYIKWANEHLGTVLKYSNKIQMQGTSGTIYDDGFYPDGSFIQHYFFAYTGGYGKHFLIIFAGLLYAFDGEECLTLEEEKKQFFFDMIHKAYEPVIYKGCFMDIVRGREISRNYHQDNIVGRHCIRAICYISQVMKEEQQKRIISMVKEWLCSCKTREKLFDDDNVNAEYFINPSLVEVIKTIEQQEVPPRGELIGNYQFGPMCKTVHLTEQFGLAISMYSKTIACYEYLNGESEKCWHVSDGVTYLYTADTEQYNQDYYGCVDMQRLPGTTVDRNPNRYLDPYFNWYMSESKNVYDFAGGATLGNSGITGMQYRGQGNGKERDLEVKKSWFMYEDIVVCLGSGITSTTGNPIETIIDNKRLKNDVSNVITIDEVFEKKSSDWSEEIIMDNVHALHITGNEGAESDIGYYFPNGEELHVLCEKRIGTWNSVAVNPNNSCENDFATVWINHGTFPDKAEYAYVLLPGKSAIQTKQYAMKSDIKILECSDSAHAVESHSLDMLGIHFWNPEIYACCGITCDSQASIIVKNNKNVTEIAIADPTKIADTIHVEFNFAVRETKNLPEQVNVISYKPFVVDVKVQELDGGTLSVHVMKE